jgi:hypothetical protein
VPTSSPTRYRSLRATHPPSFDAEFAKFASNFVTLANFANFAFNVPVASCAGRT